MSSITTEKNDVIRNVVGGFSSHFTAYSRTQNDASNCVNVIVQQRKYACGTQKLNLLFRSAAAVAAMCASV